MSAIKATLEQVYAPENIARANAWAEMLQKNESDPAVRAFVEGPIMGSLTKAGEFLMTSLESGGHAEVVFNKVALRALKVAWQQPDRTETAAFFQGLAEGLSKPGIRERAAVRATSATPIYQRLVILRREIEKLKSVPELYSFLLSTGLSDSVLGRPDANGRYKRLEKLCGRIGLSFAEPGRPKSAK
jgi:hypothetical protein